MSDTCQYQELCAPECTAPAETIVRVTVRDTAAYVLSCAEHTDAIADLNRAECSDADAADLRIDILPIECVPECNIQPPFADTEPHAATHLVSLLVFRTDHQLFACDEHVEACKTMITAPHADVDASRVTVERLSDVRLVVL